MLQYLGWQIGITYGSQRPHGLDQEYILKLLDEMSQHEMNYLSVMMQSYGYFDPDHDGYCWPVQDPLIAQYKDPHATNADPKTEFLTEIIDQAHHRGIEVELFLNWGIWNPSVIVHAKPDANVQISKQGTPSGWLHCPDSPGAWDWGLREVADLLTFYKHTPFSRFSFERVGYASANTCFCDYTARAFQTDTGLMLKKASKSQISEWKSKRTGKNLHEYVDNIQKMRPGIKVGIHSIGNPNWGHSPANFTSSGIQYVEPHTIQFKTNQRTLWSQWKSLYPIPLILNFDVRDQRPANYPIWIKTPKIINQTLDHVKHYPGTNIQGIMFFNEPMVSPANKKAVYQALKSIRD